MCGLTPPPPSPRAVVDCGHPGSPPNGVLSGDKFTFGSTVRYSCLGGRQLKGESSRTCQLNGMWSAPMPFCTGRAPPHHRPLLNGLPAGAGWRGRGQERADGGVWEISRGGYYIVLTLRPAREWNMWRRAGPPEGPR